MRSMRLAALAIALGTWLAAPLAQQTPPPADRPPPAAPPANRPPPATPPAPAPAEESDADAESSEPEEVFIPTEELQPDAAVTFPVDI
jgi:hypothetical protein